MTNAHPLDSLHSPQEIADRLEALEKQRFPQDRVGRLALDLVAFSRGPAAEEALLRLVGVLEPDTLCCLVAEHIMSTADLTTAPDYCGSGHTLLAAELARRGFDVVSGGGWRVALPGGTELGPLFKPEEEEDTGVRLCRFGLLGVWILRMRQRPPDVPSY